MFGTKNLIEKLNSLIQSGSLSDLDIARACGAIESIEVGGINSVASLGDLPPAANNKGRFFFVNSENQYVLSNGVTWSIDNIIRTITAGEAYAWGRGVSGMSGTNSITDRSSPFLISGGFTDWIQLSNTNNFSGLGVRANGTAWGWGAGTAGILGTGNTLTTSSPVSVVGGFTDWAQVNIGANHSIGLRANGTAWAWGYNNNGQLGDGTTARKSSPVSVIGGYTDWIQVSTKQAHSLGLRSNGTVWAWGNNFSGQLGDNTNITKSSPVSVVGGFTDWIELSAGLFHNLGLRGNGTAWAWGCNISGQLGDNTIVVKSSPVSIVGGFTDWTQVSAGNNHSLGLRANGTAWAWGYNGSGPLGTGNTLTASSPVSVVGGFTDWVQVDAGIFHSLGVRANGTAWAWGSNAYGRLGDNTTIARSSPVSVVGGFTGWISVSAGGGHSFGIKAGEWSE